MHSLDLDTLNIPKFLGVSNSFIHHINSINARTILHINFINLPFNNVIILG
jgi:hypothetical protein